MIDITVTLLPEPDSPTMPSTSPGLERERDAVDRAHDAVLGAERDAQVAYLEQRSLTWAAPAGRGTA